MSIEIAGGSWVKAWGRMLGGEEMRQVMEGVPGMNVIGRGVNWVEKYGVEGSVDVWRKVVAEMDREGGKEEVKEVVRVVKGEEGAGREGILRGEVLEWCAARVASGRKWKGAQQEEEDMLLYTLRNLIQ
eukprot:TRINITY_DN23094_c0_g1_i1.p2 TRINITY_DN23094_c0_g1~~TRINITY_DN23094_c0_g1_i1.p2  ORF type:complete len:137 (-),score=73.76 TRINITY_DN23094_c0_g1_i1:13-399(-)